MSNVPGRFAYTKFTIPVAITLMGIVYLLTLISSGKISSSYFRDYHEVSHVYVKAVNQKCFNDPGACSRKLTEDLSSEDGTFTRVAVPDIKRGENSAFALSNQTMDQELKSAISGGRPYAVGIPIPSEFFTDADEATDKSHADNIARLYFYENFSGSYCIGRNCIGRTSAGLVGRLPLLVRSEDGLLGKKSMSTSTVWFIGQDSYGQPKTNSFFMLQDMSYRPHFSFWAGLTVSSDNQISSYLNSRIDKQVILKAVKQSICLFALSLIVLFLITDLVYGPTRGQTEQTRNLASIIEISCVAFPMLIGFSLIYMVLWWDHHMVAGMSIVLTTAAIHFLVKLKNSALQQEHAARTDDIDTSRKRKAVKLRSVID